MQPFSIFILVNDLHFLSTMNHFFILLFVSHNTLLLLSENSGRTSPPSTVFCLIMVMDQRSPSTMHLIDFGILHCAVECLLPSPHELLLLQQSHTLYTQGQGTAPSYAYPYHTGCCAHAAIPLCTPTQIRRAAASRRSQKGCRTCSPLCRACTNAAKDIPQVAHDPQILNNQYVLDTKNIVRPSQITSSHSVCRPCTGRK